MCVSNNVTLPLSSNPHMIRVKLNKGTNKQQKHPSILSIRTLKSLDIGQVSYVFYNFKASKRGILCSRKERYFPRRFLLRISLTIKNKTCNLGAVVKYILQIMSQNIWHMTPFYKIMFTARRVFPCRDLSTCTFACLTTCIFYDLHTNLILIILHTFSIIFLDIQCFG